MRWDGFATVWLNDCGGRNAGANGGELRAFVYQRGSRTGLRAALDKPLCPINSAESNLFSESRAQKACVNQTEHFWKPSTTLDFGCSSE